MNDSAHYREDGVAEYLRSVANHRVLTREEEVALFQRLEAGDMAAREELIGCNLRFVVKVALQYKGLGMPLADLIQEGNVGLVTVVDKFDWRRGYRFSTYAAFWIRQEIQAAVRRRGSLIRLPVRKARLLGKISESISRFHQAEGRDPNLDELANFMGVEAERIEPLLPFREAMLSLEAERGDDGATLMDEVAEEAAPAPYERLAAEQTREALLKAMTVLNDREREVMFHRYGLAEDGRALSLRKTSKLVGLSQEGVRRVERRALGKLGRPGLSQSLRPLLDVA